MTEAKSRADRQLEPTDGGPKNLRSPVETRSRKRAARTPPEQADRTNVTLADRLLRWYELRRRDLPWRRTEDPYQILVSEVMLQQTRVVAVVKPYCRFVERFPTATALANATREQVRAMWSGLGYYSRADRLHEAAREISARGGVPREPAALRSLPGVGRYTAAAVASIAFGVPEPALDGNAVRVLARLHRVSGNPAQRAVRARLEAAARALLDARRPGDSNQALMELGATVCLPRRPRCADCPLAAACRGRGARVERYPFRPRARARQRERWLLLVSESAEGRLLLARRPADAGFLPGSWLLPWADADAGEEAALAQAEQRFGIRFELDGTARGRARHAITFRDVEVSVARARVRERAATVAEGAEAGWFSPAELAELATSSLVGKALLALARAEQRVGRDGEVER